MKTTRLSLAILLGAVTGVAPAMAQNAAPAAPAPGAQAPARGGRGVAPVPTRDPHNPAYPAAKELPDGTIPTANDEGNFIIGPTHNPAPEMTVNENVPHGTVSMFEMKSTDSKIYPGIARAPRGAGPAPAPAPAATPNPATSGRAVVATVPTPYTRRVAVYVPKQYVPGTIAPFIVGADGPDQMLFTALDNLIAQKRVPVMIADLDRQRQR